MQIVDTAVKKYVNRFASATDLIDGRRRYIVATLLWLCYLIGSVPPQGAIAHALLYPRMFLSSADLYLNVRGLFGRRDEGPSDGALVVNETDHDFTRLNAALRPYLVMVAVALVIAFITSGLVISFDFRWLRWAIALGALSASMYLKDLDPKLAHRRREAERLIARVAVAT